MWKEITKEEYQSLHIGLKPIESFSDPDGMLGFGYGIPAMDTVWGTEDKAILKCEMRKVSRHQQDWDYTFYKNTENEKQY